MSIDMDALRLSNYDSFAMAFLSQNQWEMDIAESKLVRRKVIIKEVFLIFAYCQPYCS